MEFGMVKLLIPEHVGGREGPRVVSNPVLTRVNRLGDSLVSMSQANRKLRWSHAHRGF